MGINAPTLKCMQIFYIFKTFVDYCVATNGRMGVKESNKCIYCFVVFTDIKIVEVGVGAT